MHPLHAPPHLPSAMARRRRPAGRVHPHHDRRHHRFVSAAAAIILLSASSSTSPSRHRQTTLASALVVPTSSRRARNSNRPSKRTQKAKHGSRSSKRASKKRNGGTTKNGGKRTSACIAETSTPDFTEEVRTLALSRYADPSSVGDGRGIPQNRARLPPWLAPHDDAFNDDTLALDRNSGGGSKYSLGLLTTRTGDEPSEVAKTNLNRLETALLRHHTYLGHDASASKCGFTEDDVADIMHALRVASRGDWSLLAGAAEFLWLLLSVEENQFMSSSWSDDESTATIELKPQELFGSEGDVEDESEENRLLDVSPALRREKRQFGIFTRDTLIASAFHYADCVEARRSGVYGLVSQAVRGMGSTSSFADSWRKQLLPSADRASHREDDVDSEVEIGVAVKFGDEENGPSTEKFKPLDGLDDGTVSDPDWAITAKMAGDVIPDEPLGDFAVEGVGMFGVNAARIARATAKIKRAEILADAVAFGTSSDPALADNGLQVGGRSTATPTRSEADTLRDMLISVSEDWRALAIRSVACLYRLRGIIRFGGGKRTPEVVKAAREAIRVYAPLAQRLGMHRLKADLEDLAFGLLYQRQYSATAVLYEQNGDLMRDVEEFATTTIEEALREDDMLLSQVDSIKVTSRVKQPYSLWKKILRQRCKKAEAGERRKQLSVQNVHDAVAVRVILSARPISPAEDVESIRTREALLCFYVQKLILAKLPPSDVSRMKDYISQPKSNGYQSLHYTAQIFRHGVDWQFEVQIRSEEMHRLAEYGVAAHWDYKLQGPMGIQSVADTPIPEPPLSRSAEDLARKLKEASKVSVMEEATADEGEGDGDIDFDCEADVDRDRDDRCSSYIEALTTAREDIKANTVYVFVSATDSALDGKILPLKTGATVADALREADERYGFDFGEGSELVCNGRTIGPNDELMNGDVVVVNSDISAAVLPAVDSI